MNHIPFSILPVEQQNAYSREDLVAHILHCEQNIAKKNDEIFLIRKKIYLMEEKEDHGRKQAEAQFDSIKEMIEALRDAQEKNDNEADEAAREAIQNDPLSVEIVKQYEILLCWGGPACRIVGDLDEYGVPETAHIEYQDWFTRWTEYPCSEDILLEYAREFYFEEEKR